MTEERRLTTRVLAIWKAIALDQRLPRRSEMSDGLFGGDCANCLLIELAPQLLASRAIHVGERLGGSGWSDATPQALADYPSHSLVRLAAAKLPAVISKRSPITFGGTGVHDMTAILYRAILLPLSEDGDHIDHVVGAINFRTISAVEEYPDEPAPPVTPESVDRVSAYMAFSSRRVSFAPLSARKPLPVSIK